MCQYFLVSTIPQQRPKVPKHTQGRPSNRYVAIKKISHIAPPPRPVLDEVVEYHLPPGFPILLSDVKCLVCLGVLVRSLQVQCGEVCCMLCLCEWVKATIDRTSHLPMHAVHSPTKWRLASSTQPHRYFLNCWTLCLLPARGVGSEYQLHKEHLESRSTWRAGAPGEKEHLESS